MAFCSIIYFLILIPIFTQQFCFITIAHRGETEFQLGSGPDKLKSPSPLDFISEFTSDLYDCSVFNQGMQTDQVAVHCCYTLGNLVDDAKWNEEKFRDMLKRIYFM